MHTSSNLNISRIEVLILEKKRCDDIDYRQKDQTKLFYICAQEIIGDKI